MTTEAQEVLQQAEALRAAADKAAAGVDDASGLQAWRVEFLGRKSALNALSKGLGSVPEADRPAAGKALNDLRAKLEATYQELERRLHAAAEAGPAPPRDVTLPGAPAAVGTLHPITQTYYEIAAFFTQLGFAVAHGPEVEDDFHNFSALNFPPEHPSRDTQDTLYLAGDWLLRTHTSPVQIRVMLEQEPPLRVIVPGRCARADAVDASHYPVFHQVEGLLVDEAVSLADLKGTLAAFAEYLFGAGTKIRFIPDYFPFTEPSADLSISCVMCGGEGCGPCGGTGWLEIAGAGMVHPNVFRNVGYDAEKWVGYAFGMGIERIAMLKYGIDDIRLFYENNFDFLKQF
ncbi:MAG: phenylalanine--tRNA ligase subunit alpha [Candidatus Coatesbacteria bacterium]|nr:MAG: phenylalanine--tRNA ligase subunit alpha [Candidatus Coatesbacteria bacterium]